jgi:hypothetical protein
MTKDENGNLLADSKTYDSVRREVLYNNLTEFGVTVKLIGLIKIMFK